MGIIQIAMIGIGAVALALMVKQQKSEYALYLSLSAVVLILVFSMNRLQVVMETIRKIEQYTGIDVAMLKILVKLMGITYVAEFASGICKDAGFSAIGSQIEMFAKFSIMAVSVPGSKSDAASGGAHIGRWTMVLRRPKRSVDLQRCWDLRETGGTGIVCEGKHGTAYMEL